MKVELEIPREYETKFKSLNADLQLLFTAFLRSELAKIEEFKSALRQHKSVRELKKLSDNVDKELLFTLSERAVAKSKLTEEQAFKLGEKLKERVAKRYGL